MDFKKVEAAFNQALDMGSRRRAEFLDALRADEPQLAADVEALLTSDAQDDALISDAIGASVTSLKESSIDPWIGQQLGRYRITKRIAVGGMGAVFLAERADQQFKQQVAIKIMGSQLLAPDAVARFKAERQILASLNHPFIAKLHDGGTTDEGLPFLVMEYIDGLPVNEYCDDKSLSVRQRLGLFEKICEAVDHAHRNLVVHRDIKPSNILVATDGAPKLLDFGIAKLVKPDSQGHTVALTRVGGRALTLEYASPEQVRAERITTATDVYSLGVLLYQLLTGYSPYETTSENAQDLEREICETDPKKPSHRITEQISIGASSTSEELGRQRSTTVARLSKGLMGDLDNIVLMALRKEPDRRYASPRAMMEDINRYLNHRPVTARPNSLVYSASKYLRRNRLPLAVAGVFLATIVGLSLYYTGKLADERDVARLEARRAEEVSGFLTQLFEAASPVRNFGEAMNARELLDLGAARVVDELDAQPELQGALMATIAESYVNMRENKAARDYLESAITEFEDKLGLENRMVLRLRFFLGSAMTYIGDTANAKPIHQRNYEIWSQIEGPVSFGAALNLRLLGAIDHRIGDYSSAESNFTNAITIFREIGERAERDLSLTLMAYGAFLRRIGRESEEEALLLEALALETERVGVKHSDYASIINNLGGHYLTRGQLVRAAEYWSEHLELQRKLNGDSGVPYANALMNMATLVMRQGDLDESLRMTDEALLIYGRGYGEDSVQFAYLTENRANTLMNMERFDESEQAFLSALAVIKNQFGADHEEYAFTQANYGNLLERTGRLEESVRQLRAAVATNERAYGDEHRQTLMAKQRLANTLIKMDKSDEALVYAEQAVAAARRVYKGPDSFFAGVLRVLARVHRDRGDFEASDNFYREALEMAAQLDTQALRLVIDIETEFAKSLITQSRLNEARRMLSQRLQKLDPNDDSYADRRKQITQLIGESSADPNQL